MAKLSKKKKKDISKEEWRCPECNRLLGLIISDNFLEIETRNRQKILIPKILRNAFCKCGVFITVSGTNEKTLDKPFGFFV